LRRGARESGRGGAILLAAQAASSKALGEVSQEESDVAEKPEELARVEIDKLLAAAGWSVQPAKEANIHAARVQQVVAYAVEMGVERAFLVYPSAIGGNLRVKVGPILVEGLAFDLGANYDNEGQRFRESLLRKMAA
jgi:hypothetical protein